MKNIYYKFTCDVCNKELNIDIREAQNMLMPEDWKLVVAKDHRGDSDELHLCPECAQKFAVWAHLIDEQKNNLNDETMYALAKFMFADVGKHMGDMMHRGDQATPR